MPRKKNPGIYILTNTVNGKQYVGLDSNLPKRANQHLKGKTRCPAIIAAIKKHGTDAFEVEIIPYPIVPFQILCWFERSHIAELNTKFPNGYNLTDGGEGGLGRKDSPETIAKRTGENNPMFGKSGNKNPFFGKKHDTETRARMSKATGKGKDNHNYGKKRSPETREKIAASKRGKPRDAATIRKMSDHQKKVEAQKRSHFDKERGQRKLF